MIDINFILIVIVTMILFPFVVYLFGRYFMWVIEFLSDKFGI